MDVRDAEVGGGGPNLPAGKDHDRLHKEAHEEHLRPKRLSLRGTRGDERQDFAHHGVGPKRRMRGGGADEGTEELCVFCLG